MRTPLNNQEVKKLTSEVKAYNMAFAEKSSRVGKNPSAVELADLFTSFVKPVVIKIPEITIGADEESQHLGDIMEIAETNFWNFVRRHGLVKEVEEVLHNGLYQK